MTRNIVIFSVAALTASLTLGAANPPPASNGSAGSFNAQFGDGTGLVWMNTDTGVVWDAASGGFVAFTLPFKVIHWNGQTFNAYNFTDITVQPTVNLTIYGSAPAMFLASQNISLAGQFIVASGGGQGGAAPDQNVPPYNGGQGGSFGGKAGGLGGSGPVGGVQGECSPELITGGGGGGGGNATAGANGLRGDYPIDAAGPPIHNPGGKAGSPEILAKLLGGGGGGAGGGGYWAGNFYGQPGANGGGAVVFATRSGSIDVPAGGVIDTSGLDGIVGGISGSSGGGAGGDAWFFAGGTFSNEGTLKASGGAGGKSTYTSGCFHPKTVKGPNGGDGSGGNVNMTAKKIINKGLIDVSGGDGGTADGGRVTFDGHLSNKGRIAGVNVKGD